MTDKLSKKYYQLDDAATLDGLERILARQGTNNVNILVGMLVVNGASVPVLIGSATPTTGDEMLQITGDLSVNAGTLKMFDSGGPNILEAIRAGVPQIGIDSTTQFFINTNANPVYFGNLMAPSYNVAGFSVPGHAVMAIHSDTQNVVIGDTFTETTGQERLQVIGTAYFGDGTNATILEADGTLTFKGAATIWNDAFVDGLSLTGGATDPPVFAAIIGTIYGNRFDDGGIKSLHGSIELPHDYKEGSDIVLHLHWIPTTANNGNCRWGVEWTVASVNGTFGAATTSEIDTAAGGTALAHKVVDVVTISGTNRKISDVIHFRVFRNGTHANDTFTGNAFLSRIAVHYECDTVGSRQITTK